MFGNEEDLKNSIPNSMLISIIHPNPAKNDFSQRILEKTGIELKERLKFSCLSNYKDIYKDIEKPSSQKETQSSRGLINKKWIDDLYNRRPALIIYFYQIPNGVNKSMEEKKIYENLLEIKKSDDLVYVFLFIISKDMKENPYNFNSDDPQKSINLRNLIQKEYIFEFAHDEIWKIIDLGNFVTNIIHFCRLYYRRFKIKIKEKKVKATSREEKIECNIKLGVLSIIKTKKILYTKSKYFDEAYDLLSENNYNKKNYLYGNKSLNPKFNLIEVRAVADWLFFKIMKLKNIKMPSAQGANSAKNVRSLTSSLLGKQNNKTTTNFDKQIEQYQKHIKNFSFLYEYTKGDTIDKFIYIEYYWLIKRFKDLCVFYEEYLKTNYNKKKLLFLGLLYLKQIYYYIKMINLFNKSKTENLTTVLVKNKEVPINKIETEPNYYIGKPPNYSYKDIHNPLMKFDLGFNEDIYFKKFISESKLNGEDALNELKNNYISKACNLFNNYRNNILKNETNCGIDLYLNMLKLLISYNNTNNTNDIEKKTNIFNISNINIDENLFKVLDSFSNLNLEKIKKFSKIYLHYLELNTNSLIYHMENNEIDNFSKTKLFTNLTFLGNLRKLKENEENIYFKLINDEQFIPLDINEKSKDDSNKEEIKPIIIKLNKEKNNENNIFDFDYNLKNDNDSHEKKILDLVEYKFKIKTSLSKENIKLNNVKIYFQSVNEDLNKKEIIIREYNKEELNDFNLNINSPINLEHKLFMKYKKGKIYLTQIEFNICKKENIIYKMELPSDLNKIIFITNLNKKVLNIKVPKEKLTVGVNQLNKFEIEVNKEQFDEVQITQFKMNFTSIPSYYKKTVPNTSMKALLNTKTTTQTKINNNTSNNINQQLFGLSKNDPNSNKMSIIPPERTSAPISKNNVNTNNSNLKSVNSLEGNQSSMQNFFYKTPNDKQNLSIQNMNKSQMFPSSTMSISQTHTTTPAPTSNLPSEKIQVALPLPEFYCYNEETKTLDKSEKKLEKEYNDFESLLKNKNKYGILIKFLQAGQYEIKLNINYSIRHRDIEDYFEFTQEETLKFIVIDPFKYCNDVYSNNFMTITKMKEDKTEIKTTEFLTKKNIQMNLILTNQLNEDVILKDIIIQLDEDKLNEKNKNIIVNSPLKNILSSQTLPSEIKNQILKILKSADYTIPFETKFNDKYQGSLGKIIIQWTTPSLIEYEKEGISLVNENSFDFPYIVISPSELDYEYNTVVNENKDVLFNIKVVNESEKCRKIIFMIENRDDISFMVSGLTKQVHSVRAKEILNVVFRLIPLIHNMELTLPKIKICEMNYNSQEKLCSYYYYPEKINII